MDTNTYELLQSYREAYYPVYSLDILETIMENFISSVPYTDPLYLLELCDIFYISMYKEYPRVDS